MPEERKTGKQGAAGRDESPIDAAEIDPRVEPAVVPEVTPEFARPEHAQPDHPQAAVPGALPENAARDEADTHRDAGASPGKTGRSPSR